MTVHSMAATRAPQPYTPGEAAALILAGQRYEFSGDPERALRAYLTAQIETASQFDYTPLVAAALLYLAITIPLARALERWDSRQG